MKLVSKICAVIIIVFNVLYFLQATFEMLLKGAGTWGFGVLILPVSIALNLLMIPAFMSFHKKRENNLIVQIINVLGAIWTLVIMYFLFSVKIIH